MLIVEEEGIVAGVAVDLRIHTTRRPFCSSAKTISRERAGAKRQSVEKLATKNLALARARALGRCPA